MTRETFHITLDMPNDVTVKQMKEYIRIAIGGWGKGGDPASPLFHINRNNILITRVPKK